MTATYDATAAMEIVNAHAPGAACVDDGVLFLEPERLVESVQSLRDSGESDLVFLCNLTAVDQELHFEVVYHLQSLDLNHILQIKARVTDREDPAVPSLTGLFYGAHLQEREVYDLFGIRFEGHPDLRRMFLWEGFPGYPLRKDFLQMPGQVRAGLPVSRTRAKRMPGRCRAACRSVRCTPTIRSLKVTWLSPRRARNRRDHCRRHSTRDAGNDRGADDR